MAYKSSSKDKGENFQVVGVVSKVYESDIKGKTYYGVFLEDDKDLYKNGPNDPEVSKGDKVKISGVKDKYGYKIEEIEVTSKSKTTTSSKKGYNKDNFVSKSGSKTVVNKKAADKEAYWEQKAVEDKVKDRRITFNAAMNTAVAMVNFGLDHELFTLAGKKKNEKWDLYVEMVHSVAMENATLFKEAEKETFLAPSTDEEEVEEELEEEEEVEEETEEEEDD